MAGNQDKTAQAEARLRAVYDRLNPMIDRAMDTLEACELQPDDLLCVQRFARAIDIVARSTRAVVRLLIPLSKPSTRSRSEEIDVRDNERDDSPENLERLRALMESQLDSVHAVLEEKRLDCAAFARPTSRRDADTLAAA